MGELAARPVFDFHTGFVQRATEVLAYGLERLRQRDGQTLELGAQCQHDFAFFGLVVVNAQSWDVAASPNYLEIREIGRQFLDKNHLLLPFEMVAVLLLVALVGAVMVAWKEGGE